MRQGHRYVKPQKRTSAPTILLCASMETSTLLDVSTEADCTYAATAVYSTIGRRYGTRWVGSDVPARFHPDDWWYYVSRLAGTGRRLFIVCPDAANLLTATAFWDWVDRGCYSVCVRDSNTVASDSGGNVGSVRWTGRLVFGGPPDIITARCNGGTICVCSLRNYTEASWQKLAYSVGYTIDRIGSSSSDAASDGTDAVDKCSIATRYLRSLISAWVARDCGNWRETVAQLSVSWWRRSFYSVKVCRHDNAIAADLEKAAAHGGRAEAWFRGDVGNRASIPDGSEVQPSPSEYPAVPGPVFRCDISSQYPAILATQPFPTRLMGTVDNPSVADLKALLRYYGVIAHVELSTEEPEYPLKRSGNTVYRIGKYDTTLAGCELQRAVCKGEVSRVRSIAYYQMGYPLRDYATHLLRERRACKDRRDYCGELLAKALSTAIGGKFSQRTTRRIPCPEVVNPFGRWGPYIRTESDGMDVEYLTLAGLCFREEQTSGGGKLLAAVYCFLTAYGRDQMYRLRSAIRPCIPYSQDTDGIWIGDTGRETLQRLSLLGDGTPGTLREVSRHDFARWITPRHYYVDGRWTLAGYVHGCRVNPDYTITEFRDINPIKLTPRGPPARIRRKCYTRQLARTGTGELIGADGWLIPRIEKGR